MNARMDPTPLVADGLGSPCNYDEDCDWMEHTYCRNQQACECKRGFQPSASSDRCLASK